MAGDGELARGAGPPVRCRAGVHAGHREVGKYYILYKSWRAVPTVSPGWPQGLWWLAEQVFSRRLTPHHDGLEDGATGVSVCWRSACPTARTPTPRPLPSGRVSPPAWRTTAWIGKSRRLGMSREAHEPGPDAAVFSLAVVGCAHRVPCVATPSAGTPHHAAGTRCGHCLPPSLAILAVIPYDSRLNQSKAAQPRLRSMGHTAACFVLCRKHPSSTI